jgi:hypothetical protein
MKLVTIQVDIEHGKLTPSHPELLPESGRGILTVLEFAGRDQKGAFAVETASDGLPVIRATGSVITSAMVREMEGLGV